MAPQGKNPKGYYSGIVRLGGIAAGAVATGVDQVTGSNLVTPDNSNNDDKKK
jgi:hypothetical protein